ncbi:hypothetical protein BJ138DRAFT_1167717 [Hygrophoropsis aurantiaca]|uniref:Uncharacterized protein n=1 Tax=Hygrophoropsis aurantiaca TaxID=72124 RepID=A0ACB7ZSP4_9AGAM|nr:hypothetical protein BJ138DRAFT_1167717 [Hygrophoropsis aurantiaca]
MTALGVGIALLVSVCLPASDISSHSQNVIRTLLSGSSTPVKYLGGIYCLHWYIGPGESKNPSRRARGVVAT